MIKEGVYIDKYIKIGKYTFFFHWIPKLRRNSRPMQKKLIIGYSKYPPYKRWGFTWLFTEYKNKFNIGDF